MKLIVMAAVLAFGGGAALAQQQTPSGTADPNQGAGPPGQVAPAESTAPMAQTQAQPQTAVGGPETDEATVTTTGDPVGGYQPAQPALSGPVEPGARVVIQPSRSPNEAFPPPAPMAKYPPCKRGQTDHCMQRGGR